MKDLRIAAVVPTHNRLELLKECVGALRAQTRLPDEIIIVNNASVDGTAEWLAAQSGLTVVSQGDLGSAGGQHSGMKLAYQRGHDWFWCMDDDTVPEPNTLERLLAAPMIADARTGYLGSVVLWKDGSINPTNRQTLALMDYWVKDVLETRAIRVTDSGLLSTLVRREVVQQCGLPLTPLFIWGDDVEFQIRVNEKFLGYLILDSRVTHKTARKAVSYHEEICDANVEKLRYGMRNMVYLKMRRSNTYRFYNVRGALRSILSLLPVVFRRCSFRNALLLTRSMFEGLFFNPPVEFP